MCGIAGMFGTPDSNTKVKKMLAILGHRGPDACGIHTEGKLSIGNTLLKITGDMPSRLPEQGPSYLTERYTIFELSAEIRLKTDSDTELLLHLERKVRKGLSRQMPSFRAFESKWGLLPLHMPAGQSLSLPGTRQAQPLLFL